MGPGPGNLPSVETLSNVFGGPRIWSDRLEDPDKNLALLTPKTFPSRESLPTDIDFSSLYALKPYTLIERKELALEEKIDTEVL